MIRKILAAAALAATLVTVPAVASANEAVAQQVRDAANVAMFQGEYDYARNVYTYGNLALVPLNAERNYRTTLLQGREFVRWDIHWTASALYYGAGPYCFGGTVQDGVGTINYFVTLPQNECPSALIAAR